MDGWTIGTIVLYNYRELDSIIKIHTYSCYTEENVVMIRFITLSI